MTTHTTQRKLHPVFHCPTPPSDEMRPTRPTRPHLLALALEANQLAQVGRRHVVFFFPFDVLHTVGSLVHAAVGEISSATRERGEGIGVARTYPCIAGVSVFR